MASRPPAPFDPEQILESLRAHGVVFIIVGGVAARLHGSPQLTTDLDLSPEPTRHNLERLASALSTMQPFKIDPRFRSPRRHVVTAEELENEPISSYLTKWGRIDVLRQLDGVGSYEQLSRGAVLSDLGSGLEVRIAALDDIIASKKASARAKDRAQLPLLEELRAELQGGAADGGS